MWKYSKISHEMLHLYAESLNASGFMGAVTSHLHRLSAVGPSFRIVILRDYFTSREMGSARL